MDAAVTDASLIASSEDDDLLRRLLNGGSRRSHVLREQKQQPKHGAQSCIAAFQAEVTETKFAPRLAAADETAGSALQAAI